MRGLMLWGVVLGLLTLGCRTEEAVSGRGTEVVAERGFTVTGPLVADFNDAMVIKDDLGVNRQVFITPDTQFFDQDGRLVARKHLEPGAEVRARYEVAEKQMVATEVLVIRGEEAPGPFPTAPTPYPEVGTEPEEEGGR